MKSYQQFDREDHRQSNRTLDKFATWFERIFWAVIASAILSALGSVFWALFRHLRQNSTVLFFLAFPYFIQIQPTNPPECRLYPISTNQVKI